MYELEERFGLEASQYRFPGNVYRPSSENGDSVIESTSRTFASTLGRVTEFAAITEMQKRTVLDSDLRQDLEQSLKTILTDLVPKVKNAAAVETKTLAHRTVLPFYLQVFDNHFEDIQKLVAYADYAYGQSQQEVLESVNHPAGSTQGNRIKDFERKYLLDSLIISGKLILHGIGETLNNFGQLLPDIKLRNPDDRNIEVTQLDGTFVPSCLRITGNESPEEREKLFRRLGHKYKDLHPLVPPIASKFGLVEVKTLFRTRLSVGNLPRKLPPFLIQEVVERMGKACVDAHIALKPQIIIYVRLRSLAPNAIHIIYPNREFYNEWLTAIDKRLTVLGEPCDDNGKTQQWRLLTMYHFLASVVNDYDKKDKAKQIKKHKVLNSNGHNNGTGDQPDLFTS